MNPHASKIIYFQKCMVFVSLIAYMYYRCDVAWFGDDCSDNLNKYYPAGFQTFQIMFAILYFILGAMCLRLLIIKLIEERKLFSYKTLKFLLTVMRSPYNLVMMIVTLIGLTRIIWITVDPFILQNRWPRSVERVLYEGAYSLLFSAYAIILWVWYNIYDQVAPRVNYDYTFLREYKNKNKQKIWSLFRMRCYRPKLKFTIIATVILQIYTSILKGLRTDPEYRIYVVFTYAFMHILLVLFIIEFIIYGSLLFLIVTLREKEAEEKIMYDNDLVVLYELISKIIPSNKKEKEKERKSLKKNAEQTPFAKPKHLFKSSKTFEPQKNETLRSTSDLKNFSLEIQQNNSIILNENTSSREIYPKKKSPNWRRIVDISEKLKNKNLNIKKLESSIDQDEINSNVSIIYDSHKADIENWNIPETENEKMMQMEAMKTSKIQKLATREEVKQIRRMLKQKVIPVQRNQTRTSSKLRECLNLFEDAEFLEHAQRVSKDDRKILKKIGTITILGLAFQIIFAILSLIVFYTSLLNNPKSLITTVYISEFLEYFSICTITILFQMINTKETVNLRLISSIGQNRNKINKTYCFTLSDQLVNQTNKRELVTKINTRQSYSSSSYQPSPIQFNQTQSMLNNGDIVHD